MLALLLPIFFAAPALAPLERPPVESEPSRLVLTDGEHPATGVELVAVYRENAHKTLRVEQIIGETDSAGEVQWTPQQAGVVVLSWAGGNKNVSVLHPSMPGGGLLIAVLAGVGLLGGSVLLFVAMVREKPRSA